MLPSWYSNNRACLGNLDGAYIYAGCTYYLPRRHNVSTAVLRSSLKLDTVSCMLTVLHGLNARRLRKVVVWLLGRGVRVPMLMCYSRARPLLDDLGITVIELVGTL